MTTLITTALQQSGHRVAVAGHYARTTWSLVNAVIAIIAGITTLNMIVANSGIATVNEVASPILQQFARIGREA
jgi:hypothetical protein